MKTEHLDALLPPEMALKAEETGVLKVKMPLTKTLVLAVLAGAFIAMGSVFSTTVTAGSTLSYGVTRLLGGFSFSLGLVLVIVGGAELFTGNNLIIMAWANKKITLSQLLKNWMRVYLGNMAGAVFIAVLMFFSKQYLTASVGINMLDIAKAKCELGFGQAVASGILCNVLVCLAVWLSYSSVSISGKVLVIIFPVTAFVVAGFEHSIANMYMVPEAILLLNFGDAGFINHVNEMGQDYHRVITWNNFMMNNLLPVTIGNIIGGAFLVGLVYWFVYLRKNTRKL